MPEQQAYQLLPYFRDPNYLTDTDGFKPFLIYIVEGLDDQSYINRFVAFLAKFDVHIKVSFCWQGYKNNFNIPAWNSFGVEFGIHTNGAGGGYEVRENKFETYWQGGLVGWDNRPRVASGRTKHDLGDLGTPNGVVNPEVFKRQLDIINANIAPNNRDRVVTLFAWNEWNEGATLEPTNEFGTAFADCLL
jgi:Glycosyltransferase WbsX